MAQSDLRKEAPLARWEAAVLPIGLLLTCLFVLVDAQWMHPGWAAYDEEAQLDLLQAWRHGQSLPWRPFVGALHRALLIASQGLLGPGQAAWRLPAILGLIAQTVLLLAWLRPRLGDRAALWAGLALLGCGSTFSQGRSLLAFSLFPTLLLAHAVALDRLRRGWSQGLFWLSAGLCIVDYEGWLLALGFLAILWAWRHGQGPGWAGRWAWSLAGLGIGLALAGAGRMDWSQHLAVRADLAHGPLWASHAADNLKSLLLGGLRLPFAGASGQVWPPLWIWPLLPMGAAIVWRSMPSACLLLAIGSTPLLALGSAAEPQRFSLALLALCAMAGAGAALAWRERRLRAVLLALLFIGPGWEALTWARRDPALMQRAYGRSQALEAAARWMRREAPAGGWQLIDRLGPYDDGAFRLMLDARGVESNGGAPLALVHQDYAPGLRSLEGRAAVFGAAPQGVILFLPSPRSAERLRSIRAELEPLRPLWLHGLAIAERDGSLAWLQSRPGADPWARTVAWERWMHADLLLNSADPAAMKAAFKEPLVSGWVFDAAADALQEAEPLTAEALRRRADGIDPRRARFVPRSQRY